MICIFYDFEQITRKVEITNIDLASLSTIVYCKISTIRFVSNFLISLYSTSKSKS